MKTNSLSILRRAAGATFALLMLAALPQVMRPADAAEVVRATSGTVVDLPVSQGQLLRIDQPVSSVFVADTEIADVAVKSAQLIYVFAKSPGTTTIYAVNESDEIMASFTLRVTHNVGSLDDAMRSLMPNRNIQVQSIEGAIVLSGSVDSPAESEDARRMAARFIGEDEEVINRLQVTAPTQVNVRVRIAEINRNVLRNLGINWDATVSTGNFAFGLLTTFPLGLSNVFPGASASTSGFDLSALMDLLAEEGLASLLAEPNLTAMSGETASFLAGGEFPVPVGQDTGDNGTTITVEWRQFGVSLAFTPTVLGSNRISMRVRPEVSALSTEGAIQIGDLTLPALTVRRAETTVELASGQTFAIAGLVEANNRITSDEVPGLADLPILGELFKSDKFQREETELVILATPYLVQPISNPNLVAMPTDATTQPEGTQRLATTTGADSGGLDGQAGFVIE